MDTDRKIRKVEAFKRKAGFNISIIFGPSNLPSCQVATEDATKNFLGEQITYIHETRKAKTDEFSAVAALVIQNSNKH